jgi:P27 family predicted phage terminase small subunit
MGGGVRKRKTDEAAAAVADPTPYTTAPEPPKRLDGFGREYWVRIAALLTSKRVLTPLHLEALETLCDQWACYVTLKIWLGEDASRWTTVTETGYESESVQARAMGNAHRNLLRLWAHFGLTPHAESRLLPERGPGTKGHNPAGMLMDAADEKTRYDEQHRPPK